jgi:hypothetical protein
MIIYLTKIINIFRIVNGQWNDWENGRRGDWEKSNGIPSWEGHGVGF